MQAREVNRHAKEVNRLARKDDRQAREASRCSIVHSSVAGQSIE